MSIRTALLVPVVFACAYGQGTTGAATFTRSYSFPPTGLASTETAQVNVVNIAVASTAANAVAPSCTGNIIFTNAGGTAIGSAITFTTTGSQISSTTLAFSALGAKGNRGEFIASVQETTTVPAKAPCSLVFSLETFDNSTGATHIFLGNSGASAGPQPGPIPVFAGGSHN